jgi:hypothetical protein
MKQLLLAVLVFVVLTGTAAAGGKQCPFSKNKGSYDRSGRVSSSGPGSVCSKKDCEMCAKEGHDHEKAAQGEESGKEGSDKGACCLHH